MLDRYMAFEEPVSRWAKLRKAVTRLGPRAGKVDRTNSSQLEQDLAFQAVFGTAEQPQECLLVTALLALAELNRYDRLLFDGWLTSIGGADWTRDATDCKTTRTDACSELTRAATETFTLATSQAEWLRHCLISSPDWQILLTPGPWREDSRFEFLAELMVEIKEQFADTTFDTTTKWKELIELFAAAHDKWRERLPGAFLPKALLLVEGQTEAVLVPTFARCLNFDFNNHGIFLQSAGGAKQVLKRFLQLHSTCNLPIVCVLDADAIEQAELLKQHLRDKDRLIHLESGEIEDAFSAKRLVYSLNQYAKTLGLEQGITSSDLSDDRKTDSLDRLWRRRGQSSFDKVGFAHVLAAGMHEASDVPEDGRKIVAALQEVSNAG